MSFSGDEEEVQFISARPSLPHVPLGPAKTSAVTLVVESGDVAQRRTFERVHTKTVAIGRMTAEHAPRFANHPSQAAFVCPVMSRQHARISFADNGQVYIADLESHHGTVIARGGDQPVYIHLVPADKYVLHDNDLVTFGKTVYKQGVPHDPVSVRVSLASSAAVAASPGIVRYGLFESDDSEEDSSDDSVAELSVSSSNTPPANPLGLPCISLPAPAPVLPSIASFSMPIASFWSCAVDQPDLRDLPPIAPHHPPEPPHLHVPIAVPMVPPPPSIAAAAAAPPVVVAAPPDDHSMFQQQVDDLKLQLSESFAALQHDVSVLRTDATVARGDEWERLRAAVKADFPDGLRDRVAELEAGLKRLDDTVSVLGDVVALRAELTRSNAQVVALKMAIAAIQERDQNNNNTTDATPPTPPSPRKRKRDDDGDEESEQVSRPSVAKRLRQGAPLVVVGAAAMYLGLCAL